MQRHCLVRSLVLSAILFGAVALRPATVAAQTLEPPRQRQGYWLQFGLHGMLAENRPQIKNTLNNVNAATEKLGPLLDQIQKTVNQADSTLKKVDGMVSDNKDDVRASVVMLRRSLENVSAITAKVQTMLDDNDYNIEELLNNLRIVSENLKEFTDTIKTRPSTLVNPGAPRDRKPGDLR